VQVLSEYTEYFTVPPALLVAPTKLALSFTFAAGPATILLEESVVVVLGEHNGRVIVVLFNVTAALRARKLPLMIEPPSSVIEEKARIFPTNELVVPSVAEEPTCHQMLQAWAP
jgi:hypothetical protein